MNSRNLFFTLSAFLISTSLLIGQNVLVRDTFDYADAASFGGAWSNVVGNGASITSGQSELSLTHTVASRDFGPTQIIRPQQNWKMSCGISPVSTVGQRWFGLFTKDMCHGYVAAWTTTQSNSTSGASYSIYRFDSSTPLASSDNPPGTCLATMKTSSSTDAAISDFSLSAMPSSSSNSQIVTLSVPDSSGLGSTLQATTTATNTIPYTQVALGSSTPAAFAGLLVATQPTVFNVMNYGAKGDGVTDDTAAITKTIAAAQAAGGSVYLPAAKKSYLYSTCIYFTGISVYGDGAASLLQATNAANSAIVLQGDHPSLSNVKITSPLSSKIGRQGTPQSGGVVAYQATSFTIDNVIIDTTASVGIMSFQSSGTAASPATISHCSIANTLADGIHMTMLSSFINVINNRVTNSGDDMFAVVSYMANGGICHDITITGNTGSGQSANGRGIAVVGGNNVTIANNKIQNTRAAGIYLQSELVHNVDGSLNYKTYGDDTITVQNNVLTNLAANVSHGGINIGGRPADTTDSGQTETSDVLISNVTISGNTITNAHNSGALLQGWFNNIYFEGNSFTTTGQQGLQVFGGSNLFVGETTGNKFDKIGQYGIYTGTTSGISTLTSGTVAIENNTFGDTNVLGSFAIPIISIGAKTATVSGNQFNPSGKYPLSTPYIRYNVQ